MTCMSLEIIQALFWLVDILDLIFHFSKLLHIDVRKETKHFSCNVCAIFGYCKLFCLNHLLLIFTNHPIYVYIYDYLCIKDVDTIFYCTICK